MMIVYSHAMQKEAEIIDKLRSARAADGVIDRMKASSMESVVEGIGGQLASESFSHGPARIVGSYGTVRYVVAQNDRGETLRVPVTQEEDAHVLGKPQVFESALPPQDIASEVLETAKTAADAIMSEDFDAAGPMLSSMARAIDVGGDLSRRLNLEIDLQSVLADRWYNKLVSESFSGTIEHPVAEAIDESEVDGALSRISEALIAQLSDVQEKLRTVSDPSYGLEEIAESVISDVICALSVAKLAESDQEKFRVFESLSSVYDRLSSGLGYLAQLSEQVVSVEEV